MKLFLDTSSLFKLYYQETGSHEIESVFTTHAITTIFLSELAKIEFSATLWRKVRMQEIREPQAKVIIKSFEKDFDKYDFVQMDTVVIKQARKLLLKYGSQGLRTLDSIQLATAVLLKSHADLFLTADKLLDIFFKQEALPT